jgi:hypothetical protein
VGVVVELEQRTLDPVAGHIASEMAVVYLDGRRRIWPYDLRLYTAPEVVHMLSEAGPAVMRGYGSYDGAPLSLESSRLLVVSKRQ